MRWRLVLVAGIVLAAGCNVSMSGSTPEPTETVTPVQITDTSATETVVDPAELPPGVDANGRVDTARLRQAHADYIENQSYTWVVTYETTGGDEDGLDQNFTRRAVVDGERFVVEHVRAGHGTNNSLYIDGSNGYLRAVTGNDTRYQSIRYPSDADEYVFAGEALRQFLRGLSFDVTPVEHNGRTFYRLYAADGRAPESFTNPRVTITDYTATVYVTPEGFVRTLVVDYDRTVTDERTHVSFRFDYRAVGDSVVVTPDWVSEVPQQPTPTDDGFENGTATADAPAETTDTGPRKPPDGANATATDS